VGFAGLVTSTIRTSPWNAQLGGNPGVPHSARTFRGWLLDANGSVESERTVPSARWTSDTLSLEEAQRLGAPRAHGGSIESMRFSSAM